MLYIYNLFQTSMKIFVLAPFTLDIGDALDWVFANLLIVLVGAVVVAVGLAFANFTIKMINHQRRELMIAQGVLVEEEEEEEEEVQGEK